MATLTWADVCKGNVEPEPVTQVEVVDEPNFVPLFEIPLFSGIETCDVVEVDNVHVHAATLPPLGDKMCDLYLVLRPEDLPKLLSVSFGVIDAYQNTVFVEWSPGDLIPVAECVHKIDSSFVQKLPIPVFSSMIMNVSFDNNCEAPVQNSVHIIHRQQFALHPFPPNVISSFHDTVFSVGRTNGFAWLHANDATSFDAWCQTNIGERLLPGGRIFWAVQEANSTRDDFVFKEREIVETLLSRGKQLDDTLLCVLNLFD